MPSKPRVLIVEDEALVAMLAVDVFGDLGFEIAEAATASLALQLAETMKGDLALALVDLGLPDMPGEDLVRTLTTRYPELPVVVASGKGAMAADAGLAEGPKLCVMPKPYTFKDIEQALGRVGVRV